MDKFDFSYIQTKQSIFFNRDTTELLRLDLGLHKLAIESLQDMELQSSAQLVILFLLKFYMLTNIFIQNLSDDAAALYDSATMRSPSGFLNVVDQVCVLSKKKIAAN